MEAASIAKVFQAQWGLVSLVIMSTSGTPLPVKNNEKDVSVEDSLPVVDRLSLCESIKSEPIVNRRELWSYYRNLLQWRQRMFESFNCVEEARQLTFWLTLIQSVGPMSYAMTLFQSLAFSAGYDPSKGPGSSCDSGGASAQCVLPWLGGTKSVSSIVLVANGVSFAVMTTMFITIGSAADYGTFGRWLLFVITIICWGAQFATISLTVPSRWPVAMALYMIGFITYGATLVFYAAAFPRLARNTARSRGLRTQYEAGEITKEEYDMEESMEKNRISNISTTHSNIGYIGTLCINLSVLIPLQNHPKSNNYALLLTNAYWVILGIWWFIFQQPRPGPPVPRGENYLTIGWKQIWLAVKQYKKLPYTFIYLFAFFLLADGLNTTGTLVEHLPRSRTSDYVHGIDAWVLVYPEVLEIEYEDDVCCYECGDCYDSVVGIIGRAYNVVFGLFQAPYYAFSQTMMAELSPPGFDNMFFGLFGLSNRASSTIGPNVIQAIIDNTGNNWMGFPFLFALCAAASLVIWFGVDVEKGRGDAGRWGWRARAERAEGDCNKSWEYVSKSVDSDDLRQLLTTTTTTTTTMSIEKSPDSFMFTVGKLGATTGSIVNIAVNRNVTEEKRRESEFWALQDDILNEFGINSPEPPKLQLRNVTQTSVTLEWPTIELATSKLRSLDIYRNGQRLAAIPSPHTNTSTKLSGLELNTEYTFQLILRTTAGTYPSNLIRVRTHTMTDTSGICVCFGNVQDEILLENAKLALREMGGRWSEKIQIDTTHFVCTTPAVTPGGAQATGGVSGAPGVEYQRALQLSIPVVQPLWILACHSEKKMMPIASFYLGATPINTPNTSNFNRPQSMSQANLSRGGGAPTTSPPPAGSHSTLSSHRASMPPPA
ncbi:hypothetical protein H0H93_004704, partial [Arthromyces matolae]